PGCSEPTKSRPPRHEGSGRQMSAALKDLARTKRHAIRLWDYLACVLSVMGTWGRAAPCRAMLTFKVSLLRISVRRGLPSSSRASPLVSSPRLRLHDACVDCLPRLAGSQSFGVALTRRVWRGL